MGNIFFDHNDPVYVSYGPRSLDNLFELRIQWYEMNSYSSSENFTASSLAKKGFGLNYGFWDNDTQRMKNMILSLDDYKKRRNMLDSGRKIIDGKGLDRITANIMKNFS